MVNYKIILLDVDQTILDFNKAEIYSFNQLMVKLGINPTNEIFKVYHDINIKWWEAFERREITKDVLLVNRFKEFFETINVKDIDCEFCNTDFLYHLGDEVFYIDDAIEFVNKLTIYYDVYLVTNGVTNTQNRRLAKTPFKDLFKGVYISESIGLSKPNKDFYDYVLNDINAKPEDCLIIGDSLTSDIQGGINSNIDTCWFNRSNKISNLPTYEIKNLMEFFEL